MSPGSPRVRSDSRPRLLSSTETSGHIAEADARRQKAAGAFWKKQGQVTEEPSRTRKSLTKTMRTGRRKQIRRWRKFPLRTDKRFSRSTADTESAGHAGRHSL